MAEGETSEKEAGNEVLQIQNNNKRSSASEREDRDRHNGGEIFGKELLLHSDSDGDSSMADGESSDDSGSEDENDVTDLEIESAN